MRSRKACKNLKRGRNSCLSVKSYFAEPEDIMGVIEIVADENVKMKKIINPRIEGTEQFHTEKVVPFLIFIYIEYID